MFIFSLVSHFYGAHDCKSYDSVRITLCNQHQSHCMTSRKKEGPKKKYFPQLKVKLQFVRSFLRAHFHNEARKVSWFFIANLAPRWRRLLLSWMKRVRKFDIIKCFPFASKSEEEQERTQRFKLKSVWMKIEGALSCFRNNLILMSQQKFIFRMLKMKQRKYALRNI